MNNLAHVLVHGRGVDKIPQRTVHLYQQAIDEGDAEAMTWLAVILKNGVEGVDKDTKRTFHLSTSN